ncbi:glutamate racemase [Sinanaerobacter chloroacetimidivorans]|uniref:Glutamate racemase n=1 Tax=Sinanaerobacter chloroacetimidivorans TaxID=2818044 RepID=A0A8J7W3C5_9FIRM|nr:glutamate racemase [Sinanaerobacter chloroacetimidivorans]MBR0600132.1 glutamate racemase [Sinanaerobacter chloroacetimidivorans]
MDNRPIGFFDSGLGGLTCIPHLMKALPKERIIYFGDTARTPYGSKAPSTIRLFSMQIADFLVKENVKMIVIACNTVSSTCLEDLQQKYPQIPIVGIISPAAKVIAGTCTKDNKIGIIGTKVTIKSQAYESLIHNLNPDLDLYSTPCPTFVPLIEEGIIQNEIMDLSIQYYLDHFISYNKIDTLVLGCTHYPLIRKNIEKLYPDLRIINPSEEILQSITARLSENDLFADQAVFENTFYASDLSENFINMINRIFENSEFKVAFKSFELDTYK